ncbi:HesA/MoeB/ThiF family protein [Candidatus Woesearchaeota archaeon]|nr:HesA/MoeB/ThiF family protein [Candidatus Woesearchaeota archaeon]
MDRYSRQSALHGIGKKGQEKIRKAAVAVIGIGALGTIASDLLARAGIGKLILVDRDIVELSNLQRQTLFDEKDVGSYKAEVAASILKDVNSDVEIEFHVSDLNHRNTQILEDASIILDCTDNIYTRHIINEFCKKSKKPWIYSAAIKEEGNVITFLPKGACFGCIFQASKAEETCETAGILNTASASVASLAVTQVLKIILGKTRENELLRFNIWENTLEKIKIKKNPKCKACKGIYEYLSGKKEEKAVKYCGNNVYQFYLDIDYKKTKEKLKKIAPIKDAGFCFVFNELTAFRDGRVLVKEASPERAKAFISRYFGN